MLAIQKPNVWNENVSGNMEIEMEVEFEKFLLAIGENTNENIDDLSSFRFYALVDHLKEKHKHNARSHNKL